MDERLDVTDDYEPIRLPPGFRFHPTDEELITHYLSPKVIDDNFKTPVVGEVDLNKVEPWDLPWKARMGEKEWYYFCVRDRKYPTGSRTNRATEAGYWKATGKDKEIYRGKNLVGMKKTLVFYGGRAPRGEKTNWVMHEYRLHGKKHNYNNFKTTKKEWVISRIFNKNSGGKEAQKYGTNLPPLMDLSCGENHERIARGSHVTCFSNPTESHRDVSAEEFSSTSRNNDFPVAQCIFSQNSNLEYGANAYALSLDREVEFKPYVDDQDFPIISTGLVDFGCLWEY